MAHTRKQMEVGKTYKYPWKDGMSVGEYTVTAVNEKNYDAVWSNGVPITISFGCPINLGSEEFDLSSLPTLMCDDSWLDIPIGDTFFIEGKIEGILGSDTESFLIYDSVWNSQVINIPVNYNGPHLGEHPKARVRVKRTEEGLETTTAWITKL